MAYANAMASGSNTESASRIGMTDWDDPVSVALCAQAIWRGRTNPAKQRAEAQAYRNLCWVAGDQWWVWDARNRKMVEDERDIIGTGFKNDWEKKLTYNQLIGVAEMKLAKMLRNNPAWDVLPATEDDSDVAKARSSKQVMDAYWQDILRMPKLTARAILWALMTKTVFFDVMWDANAGIDKQVLVSDFFDHPDAPQALGGEMSPMDFAQQQMASLYGQEAANQGIWTGKTGDVRVELASIFEVNVWPFNIIDFENRVIEMRTYQKTAEELADDLGVDVEELRVSAGKSSDTDDFYLNKNIASNWQDDGRIDQSGEDNDSILCHKITRRPCKRYPKGRTAYVVGKTAYNLQDNPYRGGQFMLVPFQDKYVPKVLWGRCTVDDLIDPQKDINLAASQESNHRNFALMPTLIRFQGDELNDSGFTNAPGKQNKCSRPELMPKFLERPQIGNAHAATIERNVTMIHEISSVGQVDTGSMDPGGKSGRFVLAQQEQNDARMLPFAEHLDEAIEQTGIRVLECIQDFGSDEQVVQLIGENNKLEVVKFKGTDLRPTNYGQPGARTAMVKCQSYSQLPSTRAELRALLDSMVNGKILQPDINPEDRQMVLSLLGIGDLRKLTDRDRKHHALQMTEIDQWKQGRSVPPPAQTDRHGVHRMALEDWMNTQAYRDIAMQNPALAQEIVDHLQMHKIGEARSLLEPQYAAKQADIQLWIEYQARAAQINPSLAMEMYPAPMGMAVQPATGTTGGGGKDEPPQQNVEKSEKGLDSPPGGNIM